MRLRGKVDGNHGTIVEALRKSGCSVESTAGIGHGFPDLVVYAPRLDEHLLIEVKMGNARLTEDEALWHATWKGRVHIVRTVEQALRACGLEVEP